MHLRLLLAAITFIVCPFAAADEYYEFYSIQCLKALAGVRIETFGMYNVGDIVWPVVQGIEDRKEMLREHWRKHEESLRHLEESQGVYVFGKEYGRYSAEPVVCELPFLRLTASAAPIGRTFVDDDVQVQYRGPIDVRLETSKGDVVFSGPLPQGASLYAYGRQGEGVVVQVCREAGRAFPSAHGNFSKSCVETWK
jgi:hypothetical protein